MAQFDYSRMQATAARLLGRFAQGEVVLRRAGAPVADAAAPWVAPIATEAQAWTLNATIKGVSQKFIDGDLVTASDLEVTAAAFADAPRVGDVLIVDGQARTVLSVSRVPAAGPVVAWTFVVKG
ncbi:hypothetical protein AEAC466_13445 [Asticcacaulis sp. AC466]|uniref:hypothetical protein n=1 Tax=Asticcacaulis sp. AC466 TaxID=1282362 RepID=UPI0003C3D77D|nr:hypothetical protein [Asticcacaulis sp. AC466]ESQ83251.1 hypothetical protein AEAC466_13445 [Asticcacaulis sp. AC466]